MITREKLEEWQAEIVKTATEHGWHETQQPIGVYMCLVMTEVAEAVEADRKNRNYKLTSRDYHDGKVGDVLYTPKGLGVEGIFLIGGWKQVDVTGRTLCSNIGYRVEDDEIIAGGIGAIWWEGVLDPFFPATKEQRDLLFQKMKEAGYEWDAEKKELRKIEQNSVRSEEDEERLNSIIESYKFLLRDYKACHDVDYIPYNSDTVIRNVVDDVNFLKSLKERCTWKPSEEQLECLLKIEGVLRKTNRIAMAQKLSSLYNDLKALCDK